jgi:hypothetical protein
MGSMTMPFLVKDVKSLNTTRPGDQIEVTLVVTDGGQWLENMVIAPKAGEEENMRNLMLRWQITDTT